MRSERTFVFQCFFFFLLICLPRCFPSLPISQLGPSQVTPVTNLVFFSMLMFFGHYWSLKHKIAFYIVLCIPFLKCFVETPQHQFHRASASLLRAACIPRAGSGEAPAAPSLDNTGFLFPAFQHGEQYCSKRLFASLTTKSL